MTAALLAVGGGWTAGAAHAGRFPGNPPPAHTGGFGEATCTACHFGEPENDPAGALELHGVPERYAPGERYRLTIRLRHPAMGAAGFQLAARTATGAGGDEAGRLAPLDERVAASVANAVTYLSQTRAGAEARDSTAWTVEWVAPTGAGSTVYFHLVGNAADGDESPFGDHIYALERRSKGPVPGDR